MNESAGARGVARNPSTPLPLLLRILHARQPDLREALASRRDRLPDPLYDAMVAHPDAEVRRRLARNPCAPGAQRGRLAEDADPEVRRLTALGPSVFREVAEPLPGAAYARLAADPVVAVRLSAVERWPDPPAGALDALLTDPDPAVRETARARECTARPEPGLLREVLLRDEGDAPWWGRKAAETAPLERALAEDLVRSLLWGRRQAVAANPHLPPDLVAELARDPDPDVRRAVAMRQELAEEQRAAIDAEVGPHDYVTPARWASTTEDPALMERAAHSRYLGLRRSAACNDRLPPALVAHLAADEDFVVRLLLCEQHPAPPPDLLWEVYHHRQASEITSFELLGRPGFPVHRFAPLARSGSEHERWLALRDPGLPEAVVDRLSRDPSGEVRRAAATHPAIGPDRLLELLELRDDVRVVEAAASHPALPVRAMEAQLARAGLATG
ncbi:LRV domain-containing protein [Streptomyces xanthophaeus]|uniref:LRV domain-containing protein n=1 Tax=Streptomyces xanthophaeus TaxID=67385 RepID=UPI003990113A